MDKQFVGQQQHVVQQIDALPSAESLNAPTNIPSEVMNKFDYISYNKGQNQAHTMHQDLTLFMLLKVHV